MKYSSSVKTNYAILNTSMTLYHFIKVLSTMVSITPAVPFLLLTTLLSLFNLWKPSVSPPLPVAIFPFWRNVFFPLCSPNTSVSQSVMITSSLTFYTHTFLLHRECQKDNLTFVDNNDNGWKKKEKSLQNIKFILHILRWLTCS